MKMKTIEEKARRYDEAIEKGKQIQNTPYTAHWDIMKEVAEHLLPELVESKDEKIRKEILQYIKNIESQTIPKAKYDSWIAWLEKQGEISPSEDELEALRIAAYEPYKNWSEKLQSLYMKLFHCEQGEQKSADKIEPKFKVGDWVVDNNGIVKQILSYKDGVYKHTDGYSATIFEDEWRMWDITKDAKAGDVLCCENGWTCIFKTLVNDETFSSYCFMDNTKRFYETGSECHTLKEKFVKAYSGKIYPATKEQRDILFQKMHEAGYEWDAGSKELKKEKVDNLHNYLYGEQEPADIPEDFEKYVEHLLSFSDGEGHGSPAKVKEVSSELFKLAQLEKKLAWSEEDESWFKEMELMCLIFSNDTDYREKFSTWLKSLKERIQSQQE